MPNEQAIAQLRRELTALESAEPTVDDLRAQLAALDGAVRRRERDLAVATAKENEFLAAVGAIDEQFGRLCRAHAVRQYTNEHGTVRVLDSAETDELDRRRLEHALTALGRQRYQLEQERADWLKSNVVPSIDGLQQQCTRPMTVLGAGDALWHAKNYRDQTIAALEGRA